MDDADARFEANIDFGNVAGYFVRLDTEDEGRSGAGAWIGLTADEAEQLAEALRARAKEIRLLNQRGATKEFEGPRQDP